VTAEGKKLVVIGTSGSTDYLLDVDQYRPTRQDRRFWPVTVPPVDLATLRVDRAQLWAEAAEFWADDGLRCDGLHDEAAPIQYQCSRCPGLRGDLSEPQDDEYEEARRDDAEEME
jgi:hypothetical protein